MKNYERLAALASVLKISVADIEVLDEVNNLYAACGGEYLVLTDEEADEAVTESIKDSLWAFRPSFLADQTDLPIEVFTALQSQYELANNAILKLIEKTCGLKNFVEAALDYDGYGHFLNPYDGDEVETSVNGTYYWVYRQN